MSQLTLNEKIQNMLDELPESYGERREHILTRQDARWMANMILVVSEHYPCHIGLSEGQAKALSELTPDSIRSMKSMVKERRRIMALIGTGTVTVMAYIGQKILDSIDPQFWSRMFHHMIGK